MMIIEKPNGSQRTKVGIKPGLKWKLKKDKVMVEVEESFMYHRL